MPYGREEFSKVAKDLAGRGHAVWNVEYRRVGSPGGGWPGTLEDVVAAIDHLATLLAAGIDLDLRRVKIAGHSAGGQLALWVCARHKPTTVPSLAHVHPVAGAGLAALTDLRRMFELEAGNNAVAGFLGGSPQMYPDRYAASSPVSLLPLGVKQLIIHGVKDETIPVDQSRVYVVSAQASGDDARYVELPEAGHMDFLDPKSEAQAVLCEWLASPVSDPEPRGSDFGL